MSTGCLGWCYDPQWHPYVWDAWLNHQPGSHFSTVYDQLYPLYFQILHYFVTVSLLPSSSSSSSIIIILLLHHHHPRPHPHPHPRLFPRSIGNLIPRDLLLSKLIGTLEIDQLQPVLPVGLGANAIGVGKEQIDDFRGAPTSDGVPINELNKMVPWNSVRVLVPENWEEFVYPSTWL